MIQLMTFPVVFVFVEYSGVVKNAQMVLIINCWMIMLLPFFSWSWRGIIGCQSLDRRRPSSMSWPPPAQAGRGHQPLVFSHCNSGVLAYDSMRICTASVFSWNFPVVFWTKVFTLKYFAFLSAYPSPRYFIQLIFGKKYLQKAIHVSITLLNKIYSEGDHNFGEYSNLSVAWYILLVSVVL